MYFNYLEELTDLNLSYNNTVYIKNFNIKACPYITLTFTT